METKKLQLTLQDLEDIRFSLLIAADEARNTDEDLLSKDLLKLYDRIEEHLEYYKRLDTK